MKHTGLASPLNHRIFLTIFISVLLILLISPKAALGVTVLGNYAIQADRPASYLPSNASKAVIFSVPAGNNYTLNSFMVRLGAEGSTTLQSDLYIASGSNPGAFVVSLGTRTFDTGAYDTYTDVTFNPVSSITLLAGQTYFLELRGVSNSLSVNWAANSPDNITPTGIFTFVSYQRSIDNRTTWTSSAQYNTFQLDADEILPTATPTDTATNTPVTPTNTPTDTPVPATGTATNTPTDTPTSTPLPPTNTPTSTPVTPTPTPTLPICIFGLPPGGVQGRVLIDVMAFYNPSLEATTNILVQGGSSWWIIDARNGFYKLWISCEGQPIWVLANTVAPNFDNVWNGAALPDAGE